jgi:hypothetical protein
MPDALLRWLAEGRMTCDQCKGTGKMRVCSDCDSLQCWQGMWMCPTNRTAKDKITDCSRCGGDGEEPVL